MRVIGANAFGHRRAGENAAVSVERIRLRSGRDRSAAGLVVEDVGRTVAENLVTGFA